MYLNSLAFATLFLVYGVSSKSNSGCKEGDSQALINQLNEFNSLLVNYANLGASAKAIAAPVPTKTAVAARAHADTKNKPKQENKDVKNHNAASNEHLKARAIETAHSAQARVAHHTHVDKQNSPNKVQLVAVHSVANQGAPSSSPNVKEHNPYHRQIQDSFLQLRQQQKLLKTMDDICIPETHKIQVANSVKNILNTYLSHDSNLMAAGSLVEEPPKKSKGKSKKIKRSEQKRRLAAGLPEDNHHEMMKRQTAGWLTMDNDANSGYNGNLDQLTATPVEQEPTTSAAPVIIYGNTPEYSQLYITLTNTAVNYPQTTAENARVPKSKKASNSSSSSDSDSSSSSSEDSSSDSDSDEESSHPAKATSTSVHHNIIVRTYDGTLHLISGTISLTRHLLGLIFVEDSEEITRLVTTVTGRYHM